MIMCQPKSVLKLRLNSSNRTKKSNTYHSLSLLKLHVGGLTLVIMCQPKSVLKLRSN